jgi:hypothetical protein
MMIPAVVSLVLTCICALAGDRSGMYLFGATTLVTASVMFAVAAICDHIQVVAEEDSE